MMCRQLQPLAVGNIWWGRYPFAHGFNVHASQFKASRIDHAGRHDDASFLIDDWNSSAFKESRRPENLAKALPWAWQPRSSRFLTSRDLVRLAIWASCYLLQWTCKVTLTLPQLVINEPIPLS
ncbi:hypothetical protein PGT21_024443 [Puccinia graminis f. sp. tritici]|uniref:Uncharacterized protein n=1 Tax=Puccinia graminis f. sp. tritici TaxID=56615 RepID=A0A5B0MM29_PUCGR|nr:hypothetical protein PGT21_024443 [Puccinia graminis f. sp. tritici]